MAAEELMLNKGFHEVGLNEILKAVGVPKGSFYHHFSSKEDFGVQMLKHYINEHTEGRKLGFSDPEYGENAIERIFGFWQSKFDLFVENGCECPCLLLKLTAEVGESSEAMRNAISDGLKAWQALYEDIFSQAIRDGLLDPETDVTAEALYLQNYLDGAIQHSVTIRDPYPAAVALKQLRRHFTHTLALTYS